MALFQALPAKMEIDVGQKRKSESEEEDALWMSLEAKVREEPELQTLIAQLRTAGASHSMGKGIKGKNQKGKSKGKGKATKGQQRSPSHTEVTRAWDDWDGLDSVSLLNTTAGNSGHANEDPSISILLAHSVLSLSSQVRLLKSISVSVWILYRNAEPGTCIRLAQLKHVQDAWGSQGLNRLQFGRKHVQVWNALLGWYEKWEEQDAEITETKKALQVYKQWVQAKIQPEEVSAQNVSLLLSPEVRQFQLFRCEVEEIVRLEVAIRPSTRSAQLWDQIAATLLKKDVAERRDGQQQRTKTESQLKSYLRRQGHWWEAQAEF